MSEDKKETKTLTIRDFKVMIEGMDMVLGEDWYPTEAQWKRIRDKINLLIETADYQVMNTNMNTRPIAPTSNVALPQVPVDNLMAGFPQVPVPNVLVDPTIPLVSSLTQLADGSKGVKTPDIDTTGGYDSKFV